MTEQKDTREMVEPLLNGTAMQTLADTATCIGIMARMLADLDKTMGTITRQTCDGIGVYLDVRPMMERIVSLLDKAALLANNIVAVQGPEWVEGMQETARADAAREFTDLPLNARAEFARLAEYGSDVQDALDSMEHIQLQLDEARGLARCVLELREDVDDEIGVMVINPAYEEADHE